MALAILNCSVDAIIKENTTKTGFYFKKRKGKIEKYI
jgi:hypothetical protein